jgi:hypothetical protein
VTTIADEEPLRSHKNMQMSSTHLKLLKLLNHILMEQLHPFAAADIAPQRFGAR